jgi:hypothetical protein
VIAVESEEIAAPWKKEIFQRIGFGVVNEAINRIIVDGKTEFYDRGCRIAVNISSGKGNLYRTIEMSLLPIHDIPQLYHLMIVGMFATEMDEREIEYILGFPVNVTDEESGKVVVLEDPEEISEKVGKDLENQNIDYDVAGAVATWEVVRSGPKPQFGFKGEDHLLWV